MISENSHKSVMYLKIIYLSDFLSALLTSEDKLHELTIFTSNLVFINVNQLLLGNNFNKLV